MSIFGLDVEALAQSFDRIVLALESIATSLEDIVGAYVEEAEE